MAETACLILALLDKHYREFRTGNVWIKSQYFVFIGENYYSEASACTSISTSKSKASLQLTTDLTGKPSGKCVAYS